MSSFDTIVPDSPLWALLAGMRVDGVKTLNGTTHLLDTPATAKEDKDEFLTLCSKRIPLSEFKSLASGLRLASLCSECATEDYAYIGYSSHSRPVKAHVEELKDYYEVLKRSFDEALKTSSSSLDNFNAALNLYRSFFTSAHGVVKDHEAAADFADTALGAFRDDAGKIISVLASAAPKENTFPAVLCVPTASLPGRIVDSFFHFKDGWAVVPMEFYNIIKHSYYVANAIELTEPLSLAVFETMQVLLYENISGPLSTPQGAFDAALKL